MTDGLRERVTIVMYHYVRDLRNSRYPEIKGLDVHKFEGQLDYIERHYSVIGSNTLLDSIREGTPLPPRPCMLTFDDGLMDHYEEVMPRLMDRGFTGLFFPVTEAAEQKRLLDVHKLHLILACSDDDQELYRDVISSISEFCGTEERKRIERGYDEFVNNRRFDTKPISYVKYLLQFGLGEEVRAWVLGRLFEERLDVSDQVLAKEWYVNMSQLRSMHSCGMEIGGHGRTHRWLDHLSKEDQLEEIKASLDMLRSIRGGNVEDWVMSYPFSGYNEVTLQILKDLRCPMGMTAKTGLFSRGSNSLEVPRLDTNDLPFKGDAEPSTWTVGDQ